MPRRCRSIVVLLVAAACTAHDAETDEARIAADSAAAALPVVAPLPDATAPRDSVPRGIPDSAPRALGSVAARAGSPGGSTAPAPPPRDTARGILALVGAEPNVRVTLRDSVRGSLTLVGAPALASLSGLDVWVAGRQRESAWEVSEFAVRAADGIPAFDGVLVERRGVLSLTLTRGGIQPITSAPAAIRAYIGQRIWLTVRDGEVQTFGVIGGP